MSRVNVNTTSIIYILLGLISILFPLVSTVTLGVISGFMCLMIALLLFITSVGVLKISRSGGVLLLVLAIICLIFSLLLMFNPNVLSAFTSFLVYIIGIFMIISGIFYILIDRTFKPLLILGIMTLIFGILYIIIGSYIYNPVHLGLLIGVWLILTGILSLFK